MTRRWTALLTASAVALLTALLPIPILPSPASAQTGPTSSFDLTDPQTNQRALYSFSQMDTRWASFTIGPGGVSMSGCGCLLSAVTTLVNYLTPGTPWQATFLPNPLTGRFEPVWSINPIYLDRFLKANGGYKPASGGCGTFIRPAALAWPVKPETTSFDGQLIQTNQTGIELPSRKVSGLTVTDTHSMAQSVQQNGTPLLVGGTMDGGSHVQIVVGWDATAQKLKIVDPWGGAGERGHFPAETPSPGSALSPYDTWRQSIDRIWSPKKVWVSFPAVRALSVGDDPLQFDALVTGPDGRRTGNDVDGTTYNEDDSVANDLLPGLADLTGGLPAAKPQRFISIAQPRDGTYSFAITAREQGRLHLDFDDETPQSKNTLLTVDEDVVAGDARKYEVTYAGGLPLSAAHVSTFTPRASIGGDTAGLTGQPVLLTGGSSRDLDGTIASFHWDFGDGETGTGETAQHNYAAAGTYTVTLTVRDDAGASARATEQVAIDWSQQRPVARITGGPFLAASGGWVTLSARDSFDLNDPSGDSLTPRWDFGDGSPPVVATEGIYRPVDHAFAAPGRYTVTLTINDGTEDSQPAATTVDVVATTAETDLDSLGVPACVNPRQHVPLNLAGNTANVVDLNAGPAPEPPNAAEAAALLNERLIDFGPGLTVSSIAAPTPLGYSIGVDWTVPADWSAGNHDVGFYNRELHDWTSITVPCPTPNHPPVADAGGTYSGRPGVPVTLDGSASGDPDNDPITYTWSLGDGTVATGAQPTQTFNYPGTFYVLLRVNDGADESPITPQSLAVVNIVPTAAIEVTAHDVSATEGLPFTATVATFNAASESSASSYEASINWGDGSPPTLGVISQGGPGTFQVNAGHTYAEEGDYPLGVTVNPVADPAATDSATATARVQDAPLHATGLDYGTPAKIVDRPVARFTDENPGATLSDFSATIDWGDGTAPSPGTVTAEASDFVVSGTHQYATLGPKTVTVSVLDTGGSTTSARTQLTVYAPAGGGSFVIGDRNVAIDSRVTFWGSHWSRQNLLSGGRAPSQFKGFAADAIAAPSTGQWFTTPGNSAHPPRSVPSYMPIIVASSVHADGSTLSGDVVAIVIVRTNPGYDSAPGHPGYGTIVRILNDPPPVR